MNTLARLRPLCLSLLLPVGLLLAGCAATTSLVSALVAPGIIVPPAKTVMVDSCPVTEPEWVLPPDDSAILNKPAAGYYYVNDDRSIWASAWWTGDEGEYLRAGEEGIKVGWFRPAGATLQITGQRIDGDSPPLHTHVPCCYPTRFQATGVYFPTEGCWEVNARAAESELKFIVRVVP